MIASAMDKKLNVKPLVGFLLHSEFWEGPCRAGIKEEMMPDVERKNALVQFEEYKKGLEGIIPQVNLLEPKMVTYIENFVVDQKYFDELEAESKDIDVYLVMGWRIPKIERLGKPLVILAPGNEGIDVCAYCRSIGHEAYTGIDLGEVNEILHGLWVRKAVACTRALVLTAGEPSPFGLMSNIRDLEALRNKFGFEIVKKPFTNIFPYMDKVTDADVEATVKKLLANSTDTRVNKEWLPNDIKYFVAAQRMMEEYGCNAFSTACHELCGSRIPQTRKFVPCLTHSLFKAAGIPSGCEEDINALLAMTVMMYATARPAFMGNPGFETDELLTLHHAVPSLCMNGFGTPDLPYKLWSFTGQGFGGKFQVDLSKATDTKITLGRFNPAGDTLSLKAGEVVKSTFVETYCSPYYQIKMDDARGFMHQLADFGHHQVLVMGDHRKKIYDVARYMGFAIREPVAEK